MAYRVIINQCNETNTHGEAVSWSDFAVIEDGYLSGYDTREEAEQEVITLTSGRFTPSGAQETSRRTARYCEF